MESLKILSENVRNLRYRSGLKGYELANNAKVKLHILSAIECKSYKKPTKEMIFATYQLSRYFLIPFDSLFKEKKTLRYKFTGEVVK